MDNFRDKLQRNGHFLSGVAEGGLTGYNPDVTADVNSYNRDNKRENVPVHASDNNYTGTPNLFLTTRYGDLPAPAGTFPWIQ